MKILIVSLKAGNGHVKAAEALEKAFKKYYPDFEVKNIDLLDYASVLSKKFYGEWYMDIVNAVPEFYEFMYEHLDPNSTKVRILSDRMNAQKFQSFVFDYNPDLIYCTHFVPGNLLTTWRKKYHKNYKIITTLTDYEAHPLWVDNEFDLYTTATDEVKDQLIKYGALENKIIVTGIPIDEKFSKSFNKEKILTKLGLENKFTVAIFAGAFGKGPIIEVFNDLVELPQDFQIIVVAGKSAELKESIENIETNKTVKVLGFIDNMDEVMAISSVAISKAGGLTVSESLAVGLPLIVISPYPGQEEANTRFLQNSMAAFSVKRMREVTEIIKNTFNEPKLLEEMRENIKRIAKPYAAREIVKLSERFMG